MKDQHYHQFFSTLKAYLIELGIDKEREIVGCHEDDIGLLENRVGKLPLAYIAYLETIGKTFLFEFMNAENMSFDSREHIEEFAADVFAENKICLDRPHLVISERRNEYISLIYLDEGDNPSTWIMSEYWDKESENLELRTHSLTLLMTHYFESTLEGHPAGFHFVTPEESKDPDIVQNRYLEWFDRLRNVREHIRNHSSENSLIQGLNEKFMLYWSSNVTYMEETLTAHAYKAKRESTLLNTESLKYDKAKRSGLVSWFKNLLK